MKTDNPILVALQEAKSSFKAGDNISALHACEAVLEHVPNHPLAHLMAGENHRGKGLQELLFEAFFAPEGHGHF